MKNVGLLIGSLIVTLVVVIGVSVIFTKKANAPAAPVVDTAQYLQKETHVRGNATASATLVEFSDFQCPACKAAQPLVSELEKKYGDKLKVVYRHFPLRQVHPHAAIAARAAEAAANQNAFFVYHDKLFAEQATWEKESDPSKFFLQYAKDLKLDTKKFETDLKDASLDERISVDEQDALALGVNATPTFYLNGKQTDAGDLQAGIDAIVQ